MEHIKKIISIILVLVSFAGSFFGIYSVFAHGTYDFDINSLSIFEEDDSCYYLQGVDKNIVFRIDIDGENDGGYTLFDVEGNPVKTKIERVLGNSFNILPPNDGYIEGGRYTLTLSKNTYFHDGNLIKAKKLVFSIEKENIERFEFTDAVIETDDTLELIDENTIDISKLSPGENDIIFGKDKNGEYAVYKIEEILDENTASISIPAIDEIYSELEIYGKYEWDANDIVSNPDIETEIIKNVKESSFFDSLISTAYAAEDTPREGKLNVKLNSDKDTNSIEVQIKITLEPGKHGLFGLSELRNQSVSLTLSLKLGLTTKCDIQGVRYWDLSANYRIGYSWAVDISLYTDEWKTDRDLNGLFSDKNKFANLIDYHKKASRITERLNELSADLTGGEIKLFDWKLPIPSVPGLYFSTEVKLFAKFEMAADMAIGQSTDIIHTVGVCFVKNKFDAYSNTYRSGKGVSLSLRGKAKAKAGIKFVLKATLINDRVANINIDPQAGLYFDLYVTIPISKVEEINDANFIYSYFEPGVYFSANINATLNILVKKFESSIELIEKKFPIKKLVFGNKKIAIGIRTNADTVRAVDNIVCIPDILFEYYDVKRGTKAIEKLKSDQLKFIYGEGATLTANSEKFTFPDAMSASNCYVTATYIHSDKKSYSTLFQVLISGSALEGKVSAYSADLSKEALEGASVKLYAATDKNTPISSTKTDENGRFAFNVSKGNYILIISAEGYQTLESNQTVGEDEIKYTEHILLIDDAQSGVGSAKGIVSSALDGQGLGGVRLKLRTNWNNTNGAYYDYETVTSSSGRYSIQGIPVGYYTVEASLNGYVTGYSNIIVLAQEAKEDFDFTITPILNEDEIRIVLTWGEIPYDLDSHLIGKTPSEGKFNVFYADKVYKYDGIEMANLDVDDTTSYGPETVTILQNIYGTYTYAVHDYSNRNSSGSNALSCSGAMVRVFIGSRQVAEYHVQTDQIGTYWTVFQIDGSKRIVPINTVSNTKPAA